MKKFLVLCSVFIVASCTSQKRITTIHSTRKATNAKEIVLEQVLSDSRCPEKTQCIWAGEVTFAVAVYDKGILLEKKECTLSPTTQTDVVAWFQKQLSNSKDSIKEVQILPYPKNGVPIKKEDYYIQLVY